MHINMDQKRLYLWYSKNKRILPFRNSKEPYKIWLAEIMLQQTQMATVIPYYNRWINHFPNLQNVAEARLSELLKLWEGLGYYARCRNFHKAAIIINRDHNGKIPEDWETFRSLPGVGDYTAAAVLSISYSLPYVVIDGNVKRVMSRVLGRKKLSTRNMSMINNRLNNWIDKENPGDFNQAMMELGAMLCKPKRPNCTRCPLQTICKAAAVGDPARYPGKIKKVIRPHYITVGGLIWRKNRFYVQKRNEDSMLGGLWEFPGGKVRKDESLEVALKTRIKEKFDLTPVILKKIGSVHHSYSHFSITFHGYHCKENGKYLQSRSEYKWIIPQEINTLAFPTASHKMFNLITKQGWDV
tara:strand:+ start:6333 stop:7397 length:1065 start_codon:yes stop_codon:yes gene_type:complete